MDKKVRIWFEKSKKPVIIVGSLLIVIVLVFIIGKSFADPNTGYLKNQTVDGLSFEKANLIYENGITTFTAEVNNESGDIYHLKTININLTDANKKKTTLVAYIGDTLESEEGKYLKASIDQDLSDSISLEYVINK